jgi:hypothetical protein
VSADEQLTAKLAVHRLLRADEPMSVRREAALNLNVKVGFRFLNHDKVNCRWGALRWIKSRSTERHEHEAQRLKILIARADEVLRQ